MRCRRRLETPEWEDVVGYRQGVERMSSVSEVCVPLSAQLMRWPRQIRGPLMLWGVGMFVTRLIIGVKVSVKLASKVRVR